MAAPCWQGQARSARAGPVKKYTVLLFKQFRRPSFIYFYFFGMLEQLYAGRSDSFGKSWGWYWELFPGMSPLDQVIRLVETGLAPAP